MCGSRGGAGGPDPPPSPLKNHRDIGLSNSSPDPLKNHKATKPALNVGPLAIRWRADVGPHIVVFGSSLLSTTKKNPQSWTPLAKLSGSAHEKITFLRRRNDVHVGTVRLRSHWWAYPGIIVRGWGSGKY